MQESSPGTNVLARFQDCVSGLLDREGVFPHVLVYQTSDTTQVEFLDLREPMVILCHCLNRLITSKPDYLVFGMDRYALPGQDVNTDDFVSVCYWDKDGWRFGVLEYQNEEIVGLRWDNKFWNEHLAEEIKMGMSKILQVPNEVKNE